MTEIRTGIYFVTDTWMIFSFTSEQGKITFPDWKLFVQTIKTSLDGTYLITITKQYRKRTSQQNRYYWLCLQIIAKELGFDDVEDLHEAFKLKFNPKEKGNMIYGGSTKIMSTKEFMEYCDKVIRYATSPDGLNMRLPDPDLQFVEDSFK